MTVVVSLWAGRILIFGCRLQIVYFYACCKLRIRHVNGVRMWHMWTHAIKYNRLVTENALKG